MTESTMLDGLMESLEELAQKAIPRSRANRRINVFRRRVIPLRHAGPRQTPVNSGRYPVLLGETRLGRTLADLPGDGDGETCQRVSGGTG